MEEMNTAPMAHTEKLSYEQLENVAAELQKRCATLYTELQNANMFNVFKRLDYLFKVVETKEVFPTDFVESCVTEVVSLMTPPETTCEDKCEVKVETEE